MAKARTKAQRDWDLKTVSMKKCVEWVFAALGRENVEQKDAPGPGAWALFLWVNESGQNKQEFYKSFATKMLPSRTEIDVEGRRRDDGEDPAKEALEKLFGSGEVGRRVLAQPAIGDGAESKVEGGDGEAGAGEQAPG